MKTFILSIIIIAYTLTTSVFAQKDALNIIDNKKRKQGIWKVLYTNGNIKYTGKFIDGNPIDTFRYYYMEGKLRALLIHNIKTKSATEFAFYIDSSLMSTGTYINKLKEGRWVNFYAGNKPLSDDNYINGKKDGICKSYNMDGILLNENVYKAGSKNGPWKQYYFDGKIKIKGNYINDKLNGPFQISNPEGVVRVSGQYIENLKDGIWMYFNDKMETVRKEEYKNGDMIKETQYIKQESPFDNPPVIEENKEPASNSVFEENSEIQR